MRKLNSKLSTWLGIMAVIVAFAMVVGLGARLWVDVLRLDARVQQQATAIEAYNKNIASARWAAFQRSMIEIHYFMEKGRNKFPNPYHARIMELLNESLIAAMPEPGERIEFIKQLKAHEPKQKGE